MNIKPIICLLLITVVLVSDYFGQPPPKSSGSPGSSGSSNSNNSPGSSSPSGPASPSSSANGPTGNGGSGFSIEAEILAYKSLQSDSEAIACDVAAYLIPQTSRLSPNGPNQPIKDNKGHFGPMNNACANPITGVNPSHGVVIVSSSSTVIANFQLWRANMVIMNALLTQARALGCPTDNSPNKRQFNLEDFIPEVGQAITVIQSILGLFAANETVSGVPGTIQDQALMDGVARQLRAMNVPVLMPDTYSPFTLDGTDFSNSPFLSSFTNLITQRVCLQTKLMEVLNQLKESQEASARIQAAKDELNKNNDKLKEAGLSARQKKAIQDQIELLKKKISDQDEQNKAAGITARQLRVNQITGLINSIDTFVTTLTGGAPPSTSTNPPTSGSTSTSGTPTTGMMPGAQPMAAGNSIPPIVSVLSADGLAQVIGAKSLGVAPRSKFENVSDWRVLSLKALESGGSLITESNILGSKVYFSGGAVATYSLFKLSGSVSCSGNVYDYGGYIRAKKFSKEFSRPDIDPTKQLIFLRGGCALSEPDFSPTTNSPPKK